MDSEQILHLLTQEYTLVLATTEEDFLAVKKVRSDVFSPKYDISPEILDSKGYLFSQDDEQSFIYLLQHKPSNKYVGTVRVFFVNKHTPIQKMPMQKDGNVKGIEAFTQYLPICEVSRLALSNELPPHKDLSALRLRSYLSMLLMTGTRVNFFLYHYTTLFAIMEPALNRILKRQGVIFQQIGNAVDYYGMRIPFAIEKKKFLEEGESTEKAMGNLTRYYLKDFCNNPEKLWHFIDNNPYLERTDIHLDRICQLFGEHGDDVSLELLLGEKEMSIQV